MLSLVPLGAEPPWLWPPPACTASGSESLSTKPAARPARRQEEEKAGEVQLTMGTVGSPQLGVLRAQPTPPSILSPTPHMQQHLLKPSSLHLQTALPTGLHPCTAAQAGAQRSPGTTRHASDRKGTMPSKFHLLRFFAP